MLTIRPLPVSSISGAARLEAKAVARRPPWNITSQCRRLAADAATAHVDRRPALAENERDALAAAAAAARDERDLPGERLRLHGRISGSSGRRRGVRPGLR